MKNYVLVPNFGGWLWIFNILILKKKTFMVGIFILIVRTQIKPRLKYVTGPA